MCVVCVCLRACVYPEPNSVTETGLGELGPGHVLSSEMDKHPFETYIRVLTIHHHRYKSRHIATSPSPSTVDARFDEHPLETHIKGKAHHIKTSHSPSRRSMPQAPSGDARQSQQTTSKPAIPHLDARFHKHPLETNVSGSTPHQNQPFPN